MTVSQLAAIFRHIITFLAGGVTFLAALHVISAGDAQAIGASLTKIGNDFADICAALAPIAAIVSAWWASYTASHTQQIRAVNAIEGVKVTTQNAPGATITTAPKI